MRVLILGGGGREHALAWKFSASTRICGLFVAPGNAGTAEIATNLPRVNPLKKASVIQACREHRIDLVFVGPEEPLAAGIVDALSAEGIAAVGPGRDAARLETSKAFSKSFMVRNGVPTAEHREFSDFDAFQKFLKKNRKRVVLKKSGLAGGKGVLDTAARDEMLDFAGKTLREDILVVEEFLDGFETSIFAVSDGKNYRLLLPCMDFKKAGEGDTGPNTGGLGAVCPLPWLDPEMQRKILSDIVEPTFSGMRKENLMYTGVLYFGLMITEEGPKVLEYNVRFGDPETQALLPLITSDFGNLWDAAAAGTLDSFPLSFSDSASLGVVIAARGYPGKYSRRLKVKITPRPEEKNLHVFHAGTLRSRDGALLTGGGRCFTVVGVGKDIYKAAELAYSGTEDVRFHGAWFRRDIGKRFMTE